MRLEGWETLSSATTKKKLIEIADGEEKNKIPFNFINNY